MDEGLQDYLSETLHHLGIALCYRNDPRLHESLVLQPEWLTKYAYALRHRAEKQEGILKHSDLEMVLQMEKDESNRACLMRIMQCFGIVHPAQAAAGLWLVPQALPCAPPAGLLDAFSDALAAKRLRYTYQKLPDDLVERVIMRRFDFIEELNEKKLLWRGGVILARKGARALIQAAPQDHQVRLTVIGPHKTRHQLADLCQLEMSNIHAEIPGLESIGEFQTRDGWLPIPAMTADPGAEQDHVREIA